MTKDALPFLFYKVKGGQEQADGCGFQGTHVLECAKATPHVDMYLDI